MILIKNGYIKPITGPDLENGCILIDDQGKIAAIGNEISVSEDTTVIDAKGRLVTPGLIDAHCHIGLHNSAVGWEGAGYNENSDPITPQMRAIDSIYPQDEAFEDAIRHGVTSACTSPGSANVVGGTFVAIKLTGNCVDKMVIKNPMAMKCAFGENPKRVYGKSGKAPISRMATASLLRELLFKTKRYMEDKESDKKPGFDMKLEAMIPILKKEIPLKAHAHRADDIMTAIRIAKEFDILLTLDHCTDGAVIAREVAESGYPAIVGPSFGHKTKVELANKSFETVAALHKAGVPVSITTDAPVTPLHRLPLCAGLAASEGLPMEAAWKAITINPATLAGISDRIGSLEIGKDADIVIWTADPLTTIGAISHTTIVNGEIVWETK